LCGATSSIFVKIKKTKMGRSLAALKMLK